MKLHKQRIVLTKLHSGAKFEFCDLKKFFELCGWRSLDQPAAFVSYLVLLDKPKKRLDQSKNKLKLYLKPQYIRKPQPP